MNNVTKLFRQTYLPVQALLVYQHADSENDYYVESCDIGPDGKPINAHPLSQKEASKLAKSLANSAEKKQKDAFLQAEGLYPENVLHINQREGFAIWYTPTQEQPLFFVDGLTIPNGKANIPALLWKASKTQLTLFALKQNSRPKLTTKLYYAPFFNIDSSGVVCMGTVKRDITESISLEKFIEAWQSYFFNSYFSHSLNTELVKGNIIHVWKELVDTNKPFPTSVLRANKFTLQSLIK
ncbi:PRTRC system protein B [Tellurirhabdus bombi]|uniref:PRTRC system protein B n=1 Tax=Tellurirhabdus bombi TaxID=2907205 RepID=UPI001F207AE0|nr:PRTRC system protein B [Tellurirhabdus bombi]